LSKEPYLMVDDGFCIIDCMKIDFNYKGNGACPLCKDWGKCLIHGRLSKSIEDITSQDGTNMQIVIYACPKFQENH